MFGASNIVRNSINIVDDINLFYVAGHNIICYKTDEQEQVFYPGKRYMN